MKRFLAILLSLIAVGSMLTACGEDQGDTTETIIPTEAVTEQPTVVSDELRERIKAYAEESYVDHGFKGAAYIVYKGEEDRKSVV